MHAPSRHAGNVRTAGVGIVALALASIAPAVPAAGPVTRVLDGVQAARSQRATQQTPIAVRDGIVYLATMEPGPSGDPDNAGDLRTVVRKGVQTSPGQWRWTATTVEDRTVADAWHTAPSVGVDETGRVHVAYNMHNLPWQYVVSREPGDIDSFEFRGQAISQAELDRYRLQNSTRFPTLGSAAIPGNQITYPAFVNDRAGRLYVSYRFAAKPARAWNRRALSTGIARYDAGDRTWTALGGELGLAPGDADGSGTVSTPRAIASAQGWTSYMPRMSFGTDGSMNVSLGWRSGNPGAFATRPCAVRTGDGTSFTSLAGAPTGMPALPDECPPIDSAARGDQYRSIGDATADSAGHHHVLLDTTSGRREIHEWTGSGWRSEPSPGAAVEIFFDRDDNLWAVGTGPSVHVRRAGTSGWDNVVPGGGGGCLPQAALDTDGRTAYVYTLGCGAPTVAVTRLDLQALLGGAR